MIVLYIAEKKRFLSIASNIYLIAKTDLQIKNTRFLDASGVAGV